MIFGFAATDFWFVLNLPMMRLSRRELVILAGEIQSPPMSEVAREEAGRLLRRVQRGLPVEMPHSRPMPTIGERVHELRVNDEHQTWRIIYRTDPAAIVVAEVFSKRTPQTPLPVIRTCQRRYRAIDE